MRCITLSLMVTFVLSLSSSPASAAFPPVSQSGVLATVVDDGSSPYGLVPWSNPSAATSCNGELATVPLSWGTTTHHLRATDAGLTLPMSATVRSVDVTFQLDVSGNTVNGTAIGVALLKRGTPDALASLVLLRNGPQTAAVHFDESHFQTGWLPDDLNAADSGVRLHASSISSLTLGIDCIWFTVHFEAPGWTALYLPLVGRP